MPSRASLIRILSVALCHPERSEGSAGQPVATDHHGAERKNTEDKTARSDVFRQREHMDPWCSVDSVDSVATVPAPSATINQPPLVPHCSRVSHNPGTASR